MQLTKVYLCIKRHACRMAVTPINAGNALQTRQCLLAEAALVGLGAVLEQPV